MTAAPLTRHPATIGESDLIRIEQALLAALLDPQPNHRNAVDHLLSDIDPAGTNSARRTRVQELLVAAVSDTHADRNRALDRLLADVAAAPPA